MNYLLYTQGKKYMQGESGKGNIEKLFLVKFTAVLPLTDTLTVLAGDSLIDILITSQMLQLYLD